jgi:hypothetical protein
LAQIILGRQEFRIVQIKEQRPCPRGGNSKQIKKTLLFFFFYSSPELVGQFKLNFFKNHPWVKGIQNCTNKGPRPLQGGEHHQQIDK